MEDPISENSTLLHPARNSLTRKGYSFPKIRCCIESKAARLILLWNFAVLLGSYRIVNVIAIFSPVAGLLTDIRFSRYKAILSSSYVIIAHTITSILSC